MHLRPSRPNCGKRHRAAWSLRLLAMPVGLVSVIALASCAADKRHAAPAQVDATRATSPTRHWVQDQRLRQIMAELSKSNPSWPKSLPQEPEQKTPDGAAEKFAEIESLADSLAQSSQHIPELATHLNMGEADRRGFVAEAQTLHDQATQLHDAAARHQVEQMQRTMDGINSTCISCHSRYRDFSGQLHPPRAAAPARELDGIADSRS